jgi:hypothetical protein
MRIDSKVQNLTKKKRWHGFFHILSPKKKGCSFSFVLKNGIAEKKRCLWKKRQQNSCKVVVPEKK